MPYVYQWGKRRGIPPSKLLIPLSYAAILGGTTTLIGTSTNLIVSALAVKSGLKPLGLFDFLYAGFPALLAGVLYMVLFGHRLLPEREDILSSFLKGRREYLIETIVPRFSQIIGKTVLEAGLRNLKGLFLVEIVRGDERIAPVSPRDVIKEGDALIFAGDPDSIVELIKERGALTLPADCHFALSEKIEVVEALIPVNSSLVGKKVRETNFRAKFDAAIIAIHRDGERLKGKIGEMVLKPGDLLLLLAGKDFWSRVQDSDDIFVVNKVNETLTVDSKRALIFLLLFLLAIALSALGVFPLFKSLLVLLAVIVLLKIATYGEIKRSIDLNIVMMAAFSFAIGIAIAKTGLADFVAHKLVAVAGGLGIVGALVSIYIITNLLTEFVTNVAAATMVFPVALSVSKFYPSAPPELFVLTVAYAASASFMTPIGYQTNLMVYGPGNYRFKDFLKVGAPLSLLFMSVIILLLSLKT
jgi:di/tricarboxylate transporter